MKCLIYSPQNKTSWLEEYFGNTHPLYLRILNKPILEFYIDFCVLCGIKQIRVVKSDPANTMEDYFGDGMKWGVDLSFALGKENDDLQKVIMKNSKFCRDDNLLVIYGYDFIQYHKDETNFTLIDNKKYSYKLSAENSNLFYLTKDFEIDAKAISDLPLQEIPGISLKNLDNIKTYYDLSMQILQHDAQHYYMPGYSNEPSEYVGMNVIFNPHFVSFEKPIMIGDNVRIKNHSFIGPNSILGNNVIVDTSSHIQGSIIYNQSYIGSELEIENKIVNQHYLINPDTGSKLEIEDKFFVSGLETNIIGNFLRRTIHSLFAIILFILYAFPNAIFGLLEILGGSFPQKGKFYISQKYEVMELPVWKMKRPKPLTLMFLRFSLDKYPLFVSAMFGKISLVGNRLQQVDENSRKFISGLNTYRPGVFDYPGMFSESFSEEENEMHELYYSHHSSIFMDIRIVLNTLFGRFFNIKKYIKNKGYK